MFSILFLALVGMPTVETQPATPDAGPLPWVRVAEGGHGFDAGDKRFMPRGFNYDHDERGRLIEDYWLDEWPKVEADFAEMRAIGANVVRVHLQFGKFFPTAEKPDERHLGRLDDLLKLAERHQLYLDLTGLGCYHKADVPAWYDALDENGRWEAQAKFWEAIAARCRDSAAVFCYDLMNEPVVAGGKRDAGDWLGPPFAGKHFVQHVSLDPAGRPRPEVARKWVERLRAAIRKQDDRHLITVGLVDWSLDRPGLTSGFVPKEIAGALDFICVHLYPESGKLDRDLETLAGFDVGKPIVIEETYPLKCKPHEYREFLKRSRQTAAGYISFYWGETPDELRKTKSVPASLQLAQLEAFQTDQLPREHRPTPIEGWTVQVDARLVNGPNDEVGREALRLLEADLHQLVRVTPANRLAKLRAVPIWLDLSHGELGAMQYHPDAGWLRDHGYSEKLAKGVHIPRAGEYASPRHYRQQPWATLHELAHAYHDRELSFDEPRIKDAWRKFVDSKKYESVLHIDHRATKHYALTNQMEFFAEMSESYFGMNDFFPFNRAELKREEPEIFELLRTIWGELP